jgi:hypothetical protein
VNFVKTVLIDRSLVNVEFDSNFNIFNNKKAMFMYVCSLIEAGASYIEVDYESLLRLPKPSGAENYIFRIGSPEEFVVTNALKFAYTVVPLKYHYIAPQIQIPAILEIEVGEGDVFDVLRLISSNIDFSPYSMIRLVGDFEPDSIGQMIAEYKRKTVIPIDICPTNTTLSALNSAIAAFKANADAVTVSFGEYEQFASLEELLIMLSAMYKAVVSPDYLSGICKASILMFSEKKVSNLAVMIRRYMYRPINIETIDSPGQPDKNRLRPPGMVRLRQRQNFRRSSAVRVLDSMGIEREMSAQIMEILNTCNVELSSAELSAITENTDEDLQ